MAIPFLSKDGPDMKRLKGRLKFLIDTKPPYGDCDNVSKFQNICTLSKDSNKSTVYKVEEKETGEEYAMKKLKPHESVEGEGVPVQFYSQTQLLLKLQHRNIVTLEGFGLGFDLRCMYMKLEFCRESLRQLLQSISPLEASEIKCMMTMLLSGMAYMHRQLIMHRDIAPENILIHPSGMLKIGGFGSVHHFTEPNDKLETNVGTPGYRAPELVCRANRQTSALDIWSLGCIFCELLLHRNIFALNGSDEMQLKEIIRVLGTPSLQSDPVFFTYPLISEGLKLQEEESGTLNELFASALPSEVRFIKRVLRYDPDKRKSADDCFLQSYFRTEPAECDPADLLQRFEQKRNVVVESVKTEEVEDDMSWNVKEEPVESGSSSLSEEDTVEKPTVVAKPAELVEFKVKTLRC